MEQDQSLEVLQIELDRLRNSRQHLQRSNFELQEALEQEGPDPDFKQAIEVLMCTGLAALQLCQQFTRSLTACAQENIVTLARQQARIARIEQDIKEAKEARHIEPLLASNKDQHMAQQDTDHLQNILKPHQAQNVAAGFPTPSVQVPSASASVQGQTDRHLQHQPKPHSPQPDTEMISNGSHAKEEAAQSMWL